MSNKDILRVLVDSREQKFLKKSLIFFKQQGIAAEQNMNKDGDLIFILKDATPIFIERKSFCDFCSSYISGHLQEQCIRLNQKDFACIIVHGNLGQCRRVPTLKHLNKTSIDKMTTNIMMLYKIPIFFVDNEVSYFKLCITIAQSILKNKNKSLDVIQTGANIQSRPDISILTSQPNIGYKKAQLLIDVFGSPKAVLEASRQELLSVKGVGDSMVADIQKLKKVFENGVEE